MYICGCIFYKYIYQITYNLFYLGFEELVKNYAKALPVINKEENGHTPRFFVRCLVEMEDFINEVWEDREGR